MSNPMTEQEIRLDIIKCLIQCGTTNTLRGDISEALALKADPLVAYVMGVKKAPAKKAKKSAKPSAKDDPALEPKKVSLYR